MKVPRETFLKGEKYGYFNKRRDEKNLAQDNGVG